MTFTESPPNAHEDSQYPTEKNKYDLLVDSEVDAEPPVCIKRTPVWLLLLGIVCIGLNLRPALSSLSTVLSPISLSVGLTSLMAGLLTTLPVLSLGLFAPLAPLLARRLGSEKAILIGLLLLALGIFLRSMFGQIGLFTGSLIAGASIGILGVLLPGIVKRDFPDKPGLMTGIYTMALCFGAAAAAGLTVPFTRLFNNDWRYSLAIWAIPALLATIIWLPQIHASKGVQTIRYRVTGLLRDKTAWQVTLYMGLQSSLAYTVFGWLPSILIDRGLTPVVAGLALSVSIIAQIISALLGPSLATRGKDQRLAIVVALSLSLSGLAGCLYGATGWIWLWVVILGLGQGACFSIALTLIVLRSRDAHIAANLSSMSQGIGYTFASFGPLVTGLIHQLTGSWSNTGPFFLFIAIGALIAGLGAGRAVYVEAVTTRL